MGGWYVRFGYALRLKRDLFIFPGRHPCVGMKIAKLELKLVLALILLGYNYDLVNESGKYPDILPEIDRNDFIKVNSCRFSTWI
jgi:cytochrome P450